MTDTNAIDQKALDSLSVAPGPDEENKAAQRDAGHDSSIAERLSRDPTNKDAQLDAGIDESMDASDPPSTAQPGSSQDAPASSGYDEEAERKLAAEKKH